MSMPFTLIQCTRCDFGASSIELWGGFYYVLDDQRLVPLSRVLGWCHTCQSVRAIEDLSIGRVHERLEEKRTEADTRRALVNRRRTRIWPLNLFLVKQRTDREIEILDFYEQEVENNIALLKIIEGRHSDGKCLVCGYFRITELDVPFVYDPETTVPLGFNHPNCGGDLFAKGSNWRLNISLSNKHYDTEGAFLYEV